MGSELPAARWCLSAMVPVFRNVKLTRLFPLPIPDCARLLQPSTLVVGAWKSTQEAMSASATRAQPSEEQNAPVSAPVPRLLAPPDSQESASSGWGSCA